ALKLLFLLNNKGTLGCRPNLLEGFHPSNSLLRFALIFELLSARQYENPAALAAETDTLRWYDHNRKENCRKQTNF
ncbi:MAG: hypothetical protein MR821_00045, partial [Clostridiales bacterium]|nr:hypothetical protein [Clostridiales bacterium]